ncbi:MAG: DUF4145 domain-containing protein [Bacteroidales bacterium]|nr:DUF4145 domain-containing protein [Bacteroidales bacterium]
MDTGQTQETYGLLKIILDFISTILWPIIVIVFILIFRKDITKIIGKAKKVELPGGISIETVGEEISKAKELAKEIKNERKPEIQSIINHVDRQKDTLANIRMIELGLQTSPSGLDLTYYKKIAETDLRLSLVGLRIDFEMMLKNLAKGFKIKTIEKEPILKTIFNLFNKGAISSRQYEFINTIFKISNAAAHGAEITKKQVFEVLEIGQVLVDDYIAWLDWGFRNEK